MGDISSFLPQEPITVKKITEWRKAQGSAGRRFSRRLGASLIGHECDRFLWYTFRHVVAPDFSGRMYRLFETGQLEEARFVSELRGIGCEVHDLDPDTGKQFEFTAIGGHFIYKPDGFALGVPEAPATWHVVEFKTMGGEETQSKDFEKVKAHGVMEAKPMHYAQMMVGMCLTKQTRALYLIKKKANDDIWSERVRYNSDEAKALMDRAESIIRAQTPPERCASRQDDFRCRFCDAKNLCWGTGALALPIPCQTCRACCHATPVIDEGQDGRWRCERHNRDIVPEESDKGCRLHLTMPSLISFASPVDAGEDWIELKNEGDGAVWRHGHDRAEGHWTTTELMRTPGPLVGSAVSAVKNVFAGEVARVLPSSDLFSRYDTSVVLWEGPGDEASAAVTIRGLDEVVEAGPTDVARDGDCVGIEYGGRYLCVMWGDSRASIMEIAP